MKMFLSIFVLCFILVTVTVIIFGNLFLFNNIWAIITLISLIMALIATFFVNIINRVEELEKKLNELQEKQQSIESE